MSDHSDDQKPKPVPSTSFGGMNPALNIPRLPPHLGLNSGIKMPQLPPADDAVKKQQEELHSGEFDDGKGTGTPAETAPADAAKVKAAPAEAAKADAAMVKEAPAEVAKADAAKADAAPKEAAEAEAEKSKAAPTEAAKTDAEKAQAAPSEAIKAETAMADAAPVQYQQAQVEKAIANPEAFAAAEEAKGEEASAALGPKGKPFLKQKQAGESYKAPLGDKPGFEPSKKQGEHMDPARSDANLEDMVENFTAGKKNQNDASLLEYKDGKKAVFKADADKHDSTALQMTGLPFDQKPNFSGREVAAAEVDKLMQLGMVPNTKFAFHGGQFGSAQEFEKGDSPGKLEAKAETDAKAKEDYDKVRNDPEYQRQRNDMQVFDFLTGNMDRHKENSLIQRNEEGKFEKLHAIDNGTSFPAETAGIDNPGIGSHNKGLPEKYSTEMVDKIRSLDPTALEAKLKGLVSDDEIKAILGRQQMILDDIAAKDKAGGAVVENWEAETKRVVAEEDRKKQEEKEREELRKAQEKAQQEALDKALAEQQKKGGGGLNFGFDNPGVIPAAPPEPAPAASPAPGAWGQQPQGGGGWGQAPAQPQAGGWGQAPAQPQAGGWGQPPAPGTGGWGAPAAPGSAPPAPATDDDDLLPRG